MSAYTLVLRTGSSASRTAWSGKRGGGTLCTASFRPPKAGSVVQPLDSIDTVGCARQRAGLSGLWNSLAASASPQRRRLCGRRLQQLLDGLHGLQQAVLTSRRETPQHRDDLVALAPVERGKDVPAPRRQRQQHFASVRVRRRALDETPGFEVSEDTAQVPGIERQVLAERRGRERIVMRQLVQHAHLRQR